MNKEKMNQIIDEAYRKYVRNTPEQHVVGSDSDPMRKTMTWKQKTDSSSGYPILERLTKEEFVNKCKTDDEFSKTWGLKIEERELSLDERSFVAQSNHYEVSQNIKMFTGIDEDDTLHNNLDEHNIPTRLITITYNNEKTEIYE